jgi:hypothetical protein
LTSAGPSQAELRLRDRRLVVWLIAKALADVAAQENRAFSIPECAHWEALNDELDVLDRKLRAIQSPRTHLAPHPVNPDHPWKAKINFERRDPPPKLPAGCWHLAIPW